MQNPVSADALVEYGKRGGFRVRLKPAGQKIGPSQVGASGRKRSVCDAVAQCDDGRTASGCPHFNRTQEVPMIRVGGVRQHLGGNHIASCNVVVLVGKTMFRERGYALLGNIDAYSQVRACRKGHGETIAEDLGARGDCHGRLAIEAEGFGRVSRNCRVLCAQRCLGACNGERGGSHFIGKNNARDISGKRGMNDLPNGRIGGSQRSVAVVNFHG